MRDPSLIILPVFTFLYKLYISSELTKIQQEIVSLLLGKHAWLAKVFNLDLFGLVDFFLFDILNLNLIGLLNFG